MSDAIVTFGGWIVALLVAVGTAAVQWRKGNIDESAMILGKWKELVDAHQSQITTLTGQIAELTERLAVAERRIRELEEENAGLKRAIAQNSQSAVYALHKPRRGRKADD